MTEPSAKNLWKCGLIALLLLAISGCSKSRTTETAVPVTIPVVPVTHATRTDLNKTVTLTAEFQPFYEVDVMAKEAGYVRHMYVDIGDHVKQGQLLATLEIPELRANLVRAKYDVKEALAQKAAAEGNVERAQAAQNIAHLSYTRIETVSKQNPGLVPLQEVDVARSRNLEAKGQIAAAMQDVQAAASHYQASLAELEREQSLYAYSNVTAPFTGVVTHRYASDGSMIQAGTSSSTQAMPVVRVSQNDVLRLMLPVPEEDVSAIHNGDPVTVYVPSLDKTFQGRVTRFADRVQKSTRTMTTEVDVKNPGLKLIPGMYAEATLVLASAKNVITVPIEAISGVGNNESVYAIDTEGIIHIKPVKTGLRSPQNVQILSGIEDGETVIVGRHTDLHDGDKIQPDFQD